MNEYVAIALFFVITFGLSLVLTLYAWFRGVKNPYPAKISAYECGFDASETPGFQKRFHIHFYAVAILFIIFDLEIVLLIPWVLNLEKLGTSAALMALSFLGLLGVGFLYEWRKGALEWP